MERIEKENRRYYADEENYKNYIRSSTQGATSVDETGGGSRYIYGLRGLGRSGNLYGQYGGNSPQVNESQVNGQQTEETKPEPQEQTKEEKAQAAAKKAEDARSSALDKMLKSNPDTFNALMLSAGKSETSSDLMKRMESESDIKNDGFSAKNEAVRKTIAEKIEKKDEKFLAPLLVSLREGGAEGEAYKSAIAELPKEEQEKINLGLLGVSAGNKDSSIRYSTDRLYSSLFNGQELSKDGRQQAVETLAGTYGEGLTGGTDTAVNLADYGDEKMGQDVRVQAFIDNYKKAGSERERRQSVQSSVSRPMEDASGLREESVSGLREEDKPAFFEKLAQVANEGRTRIESEKQALSRASELAFNGDGFWERGAGLSGNDLKMYEEAQKNQNKNKKEAEQKERSKPIGAFGPLNGTTPFNGTANFPGAAYSLSGPQNEAFLDFDKRRKDEEYNGAVRESEARNKETIIAENAMREKKKKEEEEYNNAVKKSEDRNRRSVISRNNIESKKLKEEAPESIYGRHPRDRLGNIETDDEWDARVGKEKADKVRKAQRLDKETAKLSAGFKGQPQNNSQGGASGAEAFDSEKESISNYVAGLQSLGKNKKQVMQGLVTGEAPVWELSEKEQKVAREGLKQAFDKDGNLIKPKDGEKGTITATPSMAADSGSAKSGAATSEAGRKGFVASAEAQAYASSPEGQAQKAMAFGESSEGGSGGGGVLGTIIVQLSSELEGHVQDSKQVMIQLQNASARK